LDYGEPHLQGFVGTVQKRYGVPDYTEFDALFPDGRTKLFWEHQLEEVRESAPAPSGDGSSDSLTRGAREERTIVDNQQAGRVTQKEHNNPLEAWREHVEEARRGQRAGRNLTQGLVQESGDAYKDFLDSIFLYYGESARAAERGTREG
jgi:hypothetical protein